MPEKMSRASRRAKLVLLLLIAAVSLLAPHRSALAAVVQKQGEADKLAQKGAENLRKSQWQKAAENYQKAVRANPNHVEANYGLAVANMQLKQVDEALKFFSAVVRLRPNPRVGEALRNAGLIHFTQQRFKETAEAYEGAAQLGDLPADDHYRLGFAYLRLGRKREAIAEMKRAVPDVRLAPDALYLTGALQLELGEKQEALANLEQAVRLNSNHAGALIYLGGAYFDLGRHDEALAALKRGTAIDPNQPVAYFWIGATYDALYRLDDAVLAYGAALRLQPQFMPAQIGLGIAYTRMNRFTEAMPLFDQAMRQKPDAPEPFIGMCEVYYAQGNYAAMYSTAQQAAKLAPTNYAARTILAIAHAVPGRMQEGMQEAREAVRLSPDSYWPRLVLGYIFVRTDRAQDALVEAREAVRLRPNQSGTLNLLGYVLNAVGQHGEALAVSQQALAAKREPSDEGWAFYNIATAHDRLDQRDAALDNYRQSIAAYQKVGRTLDPDELYLMGNSYLRLDQDEQAVAAFRQANKMRPNFAQSHYNLGVAYFANGDRKGALEVHNTLKKLDPTRAAKLLGVINGKSGRR